MALALVRHADAGDRSRYHGEERERPVDAVGRGQASALVPVLTGLRPVRFLSSPALRCVQTVEPAAAALGLAVEIREELYEGDVASARELVAALGFAHDVVLCSHGDVIPALLDDMAARGMTGWHGVLRCDKASVWVVDGDSARYIPPPR